MNLNFSEARIAKCIPVVYLFNSGYLAKEEQKEKFVSANNPLSAV